MTQAKSSNRFRQWNRLLQTRAMELIARKSSILHVKPTKPESFRSRSLNKQPHVCSLAKQRLTGEYHEQAIVLSY